MADKLRQVQMDKEIRERIAKDSLLNQTRAIMRYRSAIHGLCHAFAIVIAECPAAKRRWCSSRSQTISYRYARMKKTRTSPSFYQQQLLWPQLRKLRRRPWWTRASGSHSAFDPTATATPSKKSQCTWYEIQLWPRVKIWWLIHVDSEQNEPFDVLYMTFCTQQGVPRAAVQMSLDGEALPTSRTPNQFDLEAGDLIDAKVDFSQQKAPPPKAHFVRLRLVVQDKRPEVFKIDEVRRLWNADACDMA